MLKIFLFLILFKTAYTTTVTTTISLNKTITQGNKELFSGFITLNASSLLQVDFENVNKNVTFVVFQVHSHLYNITLYNNSMVPGSYVVGSNVGLYSVVKPKIDTFFVHNQNDVNLKLFIAVFGYKINDPIPGGCNMEFPVSVSPFMRSSYNKAYILVDAAIPRDSKENCNTIIGPTVVFYKMYLPERDFTEETYFEGIRKMMTMDNITINAGSIPSNGLHMRRMLSAYPGTGTVYVAVAYSAADPSAYSVYVPTTSYACSPLDDTSCYIIDTFTTLILTTVREVQIRTKHDAASMTLSMFMVCLGLFVCYFGHSFFKTFMFLTGLVSGVVVTFIIISMMAELAGPALLTVSVLTGLCFGAIWLCFWWFYGMPLISVMLPTLNLGFLVASLVFFIFPDGLLDLRLDINFWTLFISIMMLTSLTLVSISFLTNILCCAVLGAYTFIYSLDHYVGTNLKYIIINTMRRAVVPEFGAAVISPPFEYRDMLLTLMWIALSVSGFRYQHFHHRGRPPFPPPPRSLRPEVPASMFYGSAVIIPRRQYNTNPPFQSTSPSAERTPLL